MKKQLLTVAVLILTLCINSTTFAQDDTGGAAGASTTQATQPTGYHFTRNNGDGNLLAQAQIKLYYTSAPTVPPVLTEIYYQGLPLFANFAPVTADITNYASTGYVTFNIPTANIPPAIKLTLSYRPCPSQPLVTISGTD